MSLVLGPLFDQPLHPASWCDFGQLRGQTPECPRYDYRVTNGFTGVDLVNGGIHGAVDVGNAGMDWPILAPVSAPMRHLTHYDGARGREFDLGGGYRLQLWHVAIASGDPRLVAGKTAVGPWADVERGQIIARSGNTGGRLANGLPMPAHTHIALLGPSGAPVDPEPHLFGRPIEGALDDMAHFTDVPEDHRFYDAIEWMVKVGLTDPDGVGGSGEYRPDGLVTRGQLAAFLSRFARLVGKA